MRNPSDNQTNQPMGEDNLLGGGKYLFFGRKRLERLQPVTEAQAKSRCFPSFRERYSVSLLSSSGVRDGKGTVLLAQGRCSRCVQQERQRREQQHDLAGDARCQRCRRVQRKQLPLQLGERLRLLRWEYVILCFICYESWTGQSVRTWREEHFFLVFEMKQSKSGLVSSEEEFLKIVSQFQGTEINWKSNEVIIVNIWLDDWTSVTNKLMMQQMKHWTCPGRPSARDLLGLTTGS